MNILRAAVRQSHLGLPAIAAPKSHTFRYIDVINAAGRLAEGMLQNPALAEQAQASASGVGPRVAIMAQPGSQHVTATWASWMVGGVALPLCLTHPPKYVRHCINLLETISNGQIILSRELAYVLGDAQPVEVLVAQQDHHELMAPLAADAGANLRSISDVAEDAAGSVRLPDVVGSLLTGIERDLAERDKGALMIYTSGTTGRPKGVVHTHGSLAAQTGALRDAWGWSTSDRILHALPLHHIHGAVVALHTAHEAGACVEFLPRFSPSLVWSRLMDESQDSITIFMGVPTMYSYLLSAYDDMTAEEQARARAAATQLRLTVSGSAPCPLSIMERWKDLTGEILLERYGMTETGMVLSNPLNPVARRPGTVGQPLHGVRVKIQQAGDDEAASSTAQRPESTQALEPQQAASAASADAGGSAGGSSGVQPFSEKSKSTAAEESARGELLIQGPNLFKEYWRRPDATAEAFTDDGFFRSGDTASAEEVPAPGGSPLPYWRILGRTSVDILKSGGYKISALDVENALLAHPAVREVAVVGIPDERLGQKLGAVLATNEDIAEPDFLQWARAELPAYQVPQVLHFVDAVPRNAMGKVNKKALLKDVFLRG